MCSFGSCQTRFEFLSQFRKIRNAFECFVTQVQTHLPKTKRVWPMKINVICTVPQFAPCLEHICAGGGGGNVAIEVYIYMYWCLTRIGLYLSVNVLLLV